MIDITNVVELVNRFEDFNTSICKIMMSVGVEYDRLEEYVYIGVKDRKEFDDLWNKLIDTMLK